MGDDISHDMAMRLGRQAQAAMERADYSKCPAGKAKEIDQFLVLGMQAILAGQNGNGKDNGTGNGDTTIDGKRNKTRDFFKLGWIQTAGRPALLLTGLVVFLGVLIATLYTVTAIQRDSFRSDMEGLRQMIEKRITGREHANKVATVERDTP